MNQSCPECGGDPDAICNFCGNKPPNAITGEILQKAGEFANEEQRKIFYKDQDPYEAQGKNFRVHHPTQPKTQVERWEQEIEDNWKAINTCCKLTTVFSRNKNCPKQYSDNCNMRAEKIEQLNELIAEVTQPIHPRYPTGTFADDYEQKFFEEKHEGYVIEKNPSKKDIGEAIKILEGKVTLLDKIKKLLH